MRFVASLFVEPPDGGFDLGPLVPRDVTRLSVVVSTNDSDEGTRIVYGVDLGNALGEVDDSIVFERVVQLADLGAFLAILANGQLGDDVGPVSRSVDVGTEVPRPTGPSAHVVFAYAEAVGISNTVSNS